MASPAPTPVAHTPMVFLKAGGAATWSAECVKALADCGLSPDDFGSYNSVVARSRAAQHRLLQDRYSRRPGAPPPGPPTPPVDDHDRFLAQSQSGHLAQNALCQRERGNACENAQPSPTSPQQHPGAYCYSDQHAPCGPHPGEATSRGTTHWGVSGNERSVSTGPGGSTLPVNTPVTPAQVSTVAQGTAQRTAGGATDGDMATGTNGWDRRRRARESAARGASATALGSTGSAAAVSGAAPAGSGGPGPSNASAALAADCIEAFRQAAEKAMRQQVMNDYGPANYPQTLAQLQQRQAAANQAVTDAGAAATAAQAARAANPTPQTRYAEAQARMTLGQARADRSRATQAVASAPCLAQQVPLLQAQVQANGGTVPACSGETPLPPGTPPGTARPRQGPLPPVSSTPTASSLDDGD